MAASQKYLFENDFARPDEMRRRAAVYTEADMETAKTAAFEEGRASREAERRAIEEQRIAALLENIAAATRTLVDARANEVAAASEQAGALAVSIARKMLPTLTARNALTEIEGLIARTLAEMQDEPRLVVRVAESNVEELQIRIARMSDAFDGALVLLSDDELPETDCRLQWADGGADRDLDRLWDEIDNAVAAISDAQTRPEPPSPLDGLTADMARTEPHPSAPPAPGVLETDTANQESGHG